MAQPGRGDAADLRGDVRPERQRALRHRIDEAQQVLRARRFQPADELLLELGERRADPLIAVPADRHDHPMHEPRRGFRLRGKPVAQSFG